MSNHDSNFIKYEKPATTCTGQWRQDWKAMSAARADEQWARCDGCQERMRLTAEHGMETFPMHMTVAQCRELSVLRRMDEEDRVARLERQVAKDVARLIEVQVRWDRGLAMQARHEMYREMDAARVAAGEPEPF